MRMILVDNICTLQTPSGIQWKLSSLAKWDFYLVGKETWSVHYIYMRLVSYQGLKKLSRNCTTLIEHKISGTWISQGMSCSST